VKRQTWLSMIVLLSMVLVPLASPLAAQDTDTRADPARAPRPPQPAGVAAVPEWGGAWEYGPDTAFQLTRFDGGYYPGDGKVYFMGGRLFDGNTDGRVWSFDPVAGTYADMGVDLVTPISNYTMNLLQDGAGDWGFYVFGGRPADGSVNFAVQVYYPDTNTAVQLDPADDFPGDITCTSGLNAVYENKAYVAGGFDATNNHGETWVFDPTAAVGVKWTPIPTANLATARAYIMSAVVDGKIYAIGGAYLEAGSLVNVATVEVMDPADPSPAWEAVADLPEECSSSRAYGFDSGVPYWDPDGTPFGGKIVSGCGFWADENEHVYVYDVDWDFWAEFPFLQTDRRDHAGEFLPLDGGDGLPGMWVWGGRKDSDANVLISSEYYGVSSEPLECSVLLVDDDWDQYSGEPFNGTGTYYYTSTLEYLGYGYDRWDVWTEGDPTLADLESYDVVVWFTGYAWDDTINDANEADLAAYLEGGGKLFVSSEDYLYDQGHTSFGIEYLGIGDYVEDTNETDVIGNADNPIGDGLGPYDLTVPTSWPAGGTTLFTDRITPRVGAEAPFRFEASGEDNSTNVDGGIWRAAFVAWPLEGLAELEERAEVMGAALDWLCAAVESEMSLMPPYQAGGGAPGEVVTYTLALVNNLGYDEVFDLSYASEWPASGPSEIAVPNGDTLPFQVAVTVPSDANCYDADSAVVTAVAQSDPEIGSSAALATTAGPPGVGDLEGTVWDANTGLGIPDAYVYFDLGDEYYLTWTAADGSFVFDEVPACLYEGQMHAYGYYGQFNVPIAVEAGVTVTLDVTLDAGMPSMSFDPVEATVPPTTTRTLHRLLGNVGSGALNFYVTELPADTIYPAFDLSAELPTGVDPQVTRDLAASPDGTARFLVYLKEQADLSAAFQIDDWSARGWYVLDALQATAGRAQAGLRADLDLAGIRYESRYIVNALVVEGNLATVESIAARPEVAFIGPNDAIPAPEPVEMGSAVAGIDEVAWNVTKVRADEVWSAFGVTGAGITISHIDTGIDYDHPALVNQYRGNLGGGLFDHAYNWWDPYGYDPDEPYDWHSHGSHTMGTMLGDDGDANQIGMAPGATWFTCQGFDMNTGYGYSAELLECAEFLLAPWDLDGQNPDPDLRADVVNNSWGGGQARWYYNQAVYAWRAAGIFPAFSAGNAGPACGTTGAPGDMANVVASGATNVNDVIASFSSRGPAAVSGLTKPNISAPGVSVYSAYRDGGYGLMSGTSMASPHTAAEAALIWSAQPDLRGDVQVTAWIIEQTATPILDGQCGPEEPPNNVYGWGRIDAYEAVSMALSSNWDISWLVVNPSMGELAPGEWMPIGMTFDATGLTDGECYTATLKIEFNDPYVMERFVPVQICIGPVATFLPIIIK
jgi:subtilisin family serine protease